MNQSRYFSGSNRLHLAWTALALVLGASGAASAQSSGSKCSDWGDAVSVDVWQRTWVGGVAADNRIMEWEGGHAHFGDFAIARLRPDGSPDPRFGDGGSVIIDQGDFDAVTDLAVTIGGVVAAGTTADRSGDRSGARDVIVFKLDDDGARDPRFGQNGMARIDLGGSEQVTVVETSWLGDIYVTGTTENDAVAQGFIMRLDRNGRVDASFGAGGIVRLSEIAGMERAFAAKLVPGGIIVGGQGRSADATNAIVTKLDLQGRVDTRFAVGGVASLKVGPAGGTQGTAFFAPHGASAVSLGVPHADGTQRIATVLFDHTGKLLPTSQGAPFQLDVASGTEDAPAAGAFFWGRTMYLAGSTYPDDFATGDGFVARTSLGGIVDSRFGGGVISSRYDLEYTTFNDLSVNARTLTAVGWNFGEADATLPPSDALVVRYTHDGKLDGSFGQGGVVMLDFQHGRLACGPRVVVQ